MSDKVVDFHGDLFGDSGSLYGTQRVIGSGAEHVVYNHPYFDLLAQEGDPAAAVVQKISLVALRACNLGTREENIVNAIGFARQRNRRYAQLQDTFGEDMVPKEETNACRLFLRAKAIAILLPELQTGRVGEVVYATLTWQDKVWLLDPHRYNQADLLQFRLPYAEWHGPVDQTMYAAVNDRWITRAADTTPPNIREIMQFLMVQQSPWLTELLSVATRNQAVARALKKIVAGTIQYGQQYGETLDFMGEQNAVIGKSGQVKLIDVLVPTGTPYLAQLSQILQKTGAMQGLTRKDSLSLLNTLGHVRTFNFLASYLGMTDRLGLDISTQLSAEHWHMVQNILTHSSSSTDLRAATQEYISV